MITYEFNKSTNILETKIEGLISVEDMSKYIMSIRDDKSLPVQLKILTDASNAKFSEKVTKKDLINFLEVNKETLTKKDFIYDAFIISGSFETAIGMLYRDLNQYKNYRFNLFSTKEAALKWLNENLI